VDESIKRTYFANALPAALSLLLPACSTPSRSLSLLLLALSTTSRARFYLLPFAPRFVAPLFCAGRGVAFRAALFFFFVAFFFVAAFGLTLLTARLFFAALAGRVAALNGRRFWAAAVRFLAAVVRVFDEALRFEVDEALRFELERTGLDVLSLPAALTVTRAKGCEGSSGLIGGSVVGLTLSSVAVNAVNACAGRLTA
jgi:hypothetical protein